MAFLALWAAFLAAVVVVYVTIRDQPPAPPQASLGTLTQAVLDTESGIGTPQDQISLDPAHQAIVSPDQVTWWDAAGNEHLTPNADQGAVENIFTSNHYTNFTPEGGVPLTTLLLVLVPTLIIVMVIVILYWRQGAGGPVGLLRNRTRAVGGDRALSTFADVAGCDDAKLEMGELVAFLRDPDRYRELGARVPKGVLLVGPPGTGKTLLARAVAGEADCAFLSVSGSEFVEMFVGVGAARVRDLFKKARKAAPCIVFVDEIDAVGRRRGGAGVHMGHEEREQTLNQLLIEMDGFDQGARIVVIGATNRADVLDEALLRPGRFDRQVTVDPPDVGGRAAILAVHARNKPLAADADLSLLARRTPGFTGADLANLINEGALLAARERLPAIGMMQLEAAVDRVLAGPERRGHLLSLDERRTIAYHEMGHALVLTSLPGTDPVRRISIVGRGRSLGWTVTVPDGDRALGSKSQLRNRLAGLLGGRVAEEIVLGHEDITTGGADDLLKATQLARQMVTELGMSGLGVRVVEAGEMGLARTHSDELGRRIDREVDRLLDEALGRARGILAARRALLDALAARLLEVETMSGAELAGIVSAHVATVELHGVVIPHAPAASPAEPVAVAARPAIAAARRPAVSTVRRGAGAGTVPPPWLRTLLRAVARPRGGRPRPGGLSG
ncbi:MAG: ATP-dependent zinc metalloprotease FtsH [Candidatus Dormibacteria bacterium]